MVQLPLLETTKDGNFENLLRDIGSKNFKCGASALGEIVNKPDGAIAELIDNAITVLQNVVDMYWIKTLFTIICD